jgi:hypothetical protein
MVGLVGKFDRLEHQGDVGNDDARGHGSSPVVNELIFIQTLLLK